MKTKNTVYCATRNPYPTWLKYANERDHLELWFRNNINFLCPEQFTSILDVGSGLGEATARLIKVLNESGKDYRITAIEPVSSQARYCRQRFSDNPKINIKENTLEQYNCLEVDLVLAVHPLYYVPNITKAVAKLASLGSRILIVHHGSKGINIVHQAFRHLVKKGPHIISTYHDIERELERLGMNYKTECLETIVDIRTTHNPENLDGRDLIRFFLEQPKLSEETYGKISHFLRGLGDYLIHDIGIITIYRDIS